MMAGYDAPEDGRQYSQEFIVAQNAILLAETDSEVVVGITDKTDKRILDFLAFRHKKRIDAVKVMQSDITAWLGRKNSYSGRNMEPEKDTSEEYDSGATIINLVNSICLDAVSEGASDIHIELMQNRTLVRYRIDGTLRDVMETDASRFIPISSRIKVMANLNIMETRLPQDGRISFNVNGVKNEFRVSVIPVKDGESIAMRILGRRNAIGSLKELGFNRRQEEDIRKMISVPHGLVLVTGPTGSGKTTTLTTILGELACSEKKIVSIEDPVEYVMEGVTQIQINPATGKDFGGMLRHVLRHDPDIIMVGEIRDAETAATCVRAALTGHLVLSTLHTNDSFGAVQRLRDLGVESFLIASVLKGVIAQRLVRKLDKDNCDFRGRTVVGECFFADETLSRMISEERSDEEVMEHFSRIGIKLLKDHALEILAEGTTTRQEIEKEIRLE